ncbi:MAG: TolC family protein [Bacteroidota bacterium]
MKYLFAALFCTLSLNVLFSQADTMRLTLNEVVAMAQGRAPDVQIARTAFTNNFWRFRSYQADLKPQLRLNATLPDLDRSIDAITQNDGSLLFLNRSQMRNSVGISVEQQIGLTGGSVFLSSDLERLDLLGSAFSGADRISYFSTPIAIGINQPLFRFNPWRWDKQIEPLRFEESQRAYSEDMEQVAYGAAEFFFDILIAQLNLEAAYRDKANADTLFNISKGRFDVGRIAETELLQIELSAMNADAALAQSALNLQTSTERLRNFLGIQEAIQFRLTPPISIPQFTIDSEKAISFARKNRSRVLAFQRRLLESERQVDEARKEAGVNMDLFLYFGLSQTSNALDQAYVDPLDQERVRVGINMPIADWGKTKSRIEIAESNRALTELQVNQERINFERDILIKVQQFDLVRQQVALALRSYEIAQKSLDITRKRYLIGKILITDLNIAIAAEASARQAYISALRTFWLALYDLRRLTLYDFENDRPLILDPEG